jgi:hypothetical protein
MKPHAWAEVYRYARAMVSLRRAYVVLVNVTTVTVV